MPTQPNSEKENVPTGHSSVNPYGPPNKRNTENRAREDERQRQQQPQKHKEDHLTLAMDQSLKLTQGSVKKCKETGARNNKKRKQSNTHRLLCTVRPSHTVQTVHTNSLEQEEEQGSATQRAPSSLPRFQILQKRQGDCSSQQSSTTKHTNKQQHQRTGTRGGRQTTHSNGSKNRLLQTNT